jgi:hypothetical protein
MIMSYIVVHPMTVRGQAYQVSVGDDGRFTAEHNGKTVFSETYRVPGGHR